MVTDTTPKSKQTCNMEPAIISWGHLQDVRSLSPRSWLDGVGMWMRSTLQMGFDHLRAQFSAQASVIYSWSLARPFALFWKNWRVKRRPELASPREARSFFAVGPGSWKTRRSKPFCRDFRTWLSEETLGSSILESYSICCHKWRDITPSLADHKTSARHQPDRFIWKWGSPN